jgi:hypothetical protein
MEDERDEPLRGASRPGRAKAAAARRERQATALRANLRRRKEQARGREADTPDGGRGDEGEEV